MNARRLASVAGLLVFLTAAAFLAVGVQPAAASGAVTLPAPSTAEPFFNPDNQAFVSSVLQDIQAVPTALPTEITNPATGADITTAQEAAGLTELEMAAGTLPTLSVLTLGGAALYTGWKIGSPLGGYIYKKITGEEGTSVSGFAPTWVCNKGPGTDVGSANCTTLGSVSGFPSPLADTTKTSFWYLKIAGDVGFCTNGYSSNGCGGVVTTGIRAYANSIAGSDAVTNTAAVTGCENGAVSGTVPVGDCMVVIRGWQEMRRDMHISNSTATEYGSASQQVDNGGWNVPSVSSQGYANAIQQAKDTTDANAQAGRAYIDCLIDPSWCANPVTTGGGGGGGTTTGTQLAPVYLPTPLPGETLGDYVERLRAKQYVGAITVVDDPMSYPSGSPALQLSPYTVTQVNTGTDVVPVYDGATGQLSPWPADPPQIQTSSSATDIQITEVPPDYVPAPGGGPSLDFSPFTSMTSTCNFPFGVLCWIHDAVNAFDVPPVAPDLNWTLPNVDMGSLGTLTMGQHYDVNLGTIGFDTYMGWIRDLETFVLWFGAIWYVGSRLIGLKGGGDPSVAADEAFGAFTE